MMRIAAYCRVSTAKEEQLDSLANQREFFESYAKMQGYDLVCIYADEGISGTRLQRREEFQRLLRDAGEHRFELVVVKDISRFARNTVDFLQSIRALKEVGVNTRFLTADMDSLGESEFVLTVFGALAQEESANLSKRVKFGKRLNAEKGRVPRCVFGYDRVDNFTLSIRESEAEVVRQIYAMYIDQGLGCRKIAQQLNDWGYATKRGCGWTPAGVYRILSSPLYCGRHTNHKYEVENYLTGKQRRLPPEEQFYHPRPQWAIISPQRFDQAEQQRRSRRIREPEGESGQRTRYSGRHIFSGLMVCMECGKHFCRKTYTYTNARTYWKCSGNDHGTCSNRTKVEEGALIRVLREHVYQCISNQEIFLRGIVQQVLEHGQRGTTISAELQRLRGKKSRYQQLYVAEQMTLEELKEKQEKIVDRIKDLETLVCRETLQADQVRCLLDGYMRWDGLTRGDVAKLVERIEVDSGGQVSVLLQKGGHLPSCSQ